MIHIIPISDLQTKAKKYVDQVKKTGEAVVITQRGRASAVLVDFENYEGHSATQDELSYRDWKKRLSRAEKESGRGIPLDSYLRKRAGRSR